MVFINYYNICIFHRWKQEACSANSRLNSEFEELQFELETNKKEVRRLTANLAGKQADNRHLAEEINILKCDNKVGVCYEIFKEL